MRQPQHPTLGGSHSLSLYFLFSYVYIGAPYTLYIYRKLVQSSFTVLIFSLFLFTYSALPVDSQFT